LISGHSKIGESVKYTFSPFFDHMLNKPQLHRTRNDSGLGVRISGHYSELQDTTIMVRRENLYLL